jgi:serine/threonine protein kinase
MSDVSQRVTAIDRELCGRGGYSGVRYIASGNFAHVFGAIKQAPDGTFMDIAVKVLDIKIRTQEPTEKEDIQHLHSVVHEISCMLKLSSYCRSIDIPVARMYDYFDLKVGDDVYAAMELEFCPHGSLESYRMGLFGDKTLDILITQLLTGLAAIDACNIIHRDIKPENILIKSIEPLVIKIADFGLARLGDDIHLLPLSQKIPRFLMRYATAYFPLRTDTKFVKAGKFDTKICGTPYFMAPEMFVDRTFSSKSDVWSIAATIFVLMTGEMPKNVYKGESIAEFSALMKANPNPDWEVYDKLVVKGKRFTDIRNWLEKLFEPDPRKRPTSIVAFGSFITTHAGNRQTEPVPTSEDEPCDSEWVELQSSPRKCHPKSLTEAIIETYVNRMS